ncbi:MAG: N-acetylmuramoyl-L-alanine amidase, partial [Prevotella sp.]|nr:N-acetylmuramoyl-L-alanine amidase [Prevotella sp.]
MRKRCLLIITMILSVFAVAMAANNDKFVLVIDPGHGGKDAGALGAKSKEKNINLNVALAFGGYVERNCPDVKVIYTRKTDVFIPLNERANIANKHKADLFISVHTNSLPNGRVARGFEVYTLGMHRAADNLEVAKRENAAILVEKDYKQHYEDFDPNSSESYIIFEFMQDKNMAKSVELAKMIQKDACETAGRVNKGVHQAGFLVLRATSMPSCLIELGFITSQEEENYLNSAVGIDALGIGIYKAFLRYKKKYHKGITVPYAAEPTTQVNIPSVVPQQENVRQEKKKTTPKEQPVAVAEERQQPEQAPKMSGLMDSQPT